MLWDLEGSVPRRPGDPGAAGEARVMRPGSDLTLVSWSRMVHDCVAAADVLAAEGVSAEVIDLRTLWPWDQEMVLGSAARTGRLLVAHEAVTVSGFGAEIAATAGEALFGRLNAPVRRLGAPRAPVPYAPPLEAQVRPEAADVVAAARTLIE